MKEFMDDNFLLSNKTAINLYHNHAAHMPIYDYHCHLDPKEIWENKNFENITKVWLYGDHYKWRALRANGVEEKYVAGDGSDFDKFKAWANTVPYTIGNPLYHWTHLELRRYFDIKDLLNHETAQRIWDETGEKLKGADYSPRGFIERSGVKLLCTTDDPTDDLLYHEKIGDIKDFKTKVLPAFRPDKGVEIAGGAFKDWVTNLEKISGKGLDSFDKYLSALKDRFNYFHEKGCRLSDHGLEYVPFKEASYDKLNNIFKKGRGQEEITKDEEDAFKTALLLFFGGLYAQNGWTMQIHTNAIRSNNTKMLGRLGPDTGFDSIHDHSMAGNLSRLLDSLDKVDALPRTILYSLNPKDNYVFASMAGNFQGDGIPGKIQLGSAWWFNDQKDGMEEQMRALANTGLLSRFIGMLTDSRSFMSYPRHEYFRRILCNIIGQWVENGEAPNDMDLLGKMVENISFNNAKNYFSMIL